MKFIDDHRVDRAAEGNWGWLPIADLRNSRDSTSKVQKGIQVKGRVAVFGEAALSSAQVTLRDGEKVASMGMNSEGAEQNAQFALNVVHWLSGLIP